ncbi:hypothetical protein EI94DRAFT_314226 [Lactarius quietus]|nr:hypothetical protein EI94DRAFT_314226 [Lactarius quietus]
MKSRFTPAPTGFLSPLALGFPHTEGAETSRTTPEQVIPKERGSTAVETLPNSTPSSDVSLPGPTSVTGWRLRQLLLIPHPEAVTTPQSPRESVLSPSTSNVPFSSATSLQTGMGGFSS